MIEAVVAAGRRRGARESLLLRRLGRQLEHLVEAPDRDGKPSLSYRLGERRVLLEEVRAHDNPRGFAQRQESNDLLRAELLLERDDGGTGTQDAEVGHAPLRQVLRESATREAGRTPFRVKEGGRAQRALAKISVSIALLDAVSLDAHGEPSGVVLGARFEELDEVAVGVDATRLRVSLSSNRGKTHFWRPGRWTFSQ